MFANKIHSVQAALLGALLLLALAFVGAFYIASAAVDLLRAYLSAPSAEALVGLVAIAPLALALLANAFAGKQKPSHDHEAALNAADLPEHVRELLQTVQALTRSAPIAAVALAVVAGFILMRSPNALPLVISAFAAQAAQAQRV